eukprot:gb/GFBE01055842.1/.p1 GENE.gb/GFBE01055842.1/~~gb/GFBE01055842.1/.p1  ORF type:complete len:337 (+),score=59.44 gb/GFBE01055842.1/:1-1011(+)
MYYVCKGCTDACAGCGKACDESCKCCNGACKQCSKCMDDTCGKCCDPITKVLERPLGTLVVLAWIFNIPSAILLGVTFADGEVRACEVRSMVVYCGVNIFFALVHAGFAIYMQSRLVQGLEQAQGGMTHEPTPKELMERMWHIILYDVGFCIYIIIFLGSFGFNCYALGWPSNCGAGAMPSLAGGLLIFYAFVVVNFGLMYWCMLACTDCCSGCFGSSTTAKILLGSRYGTPGGHQGQHIQVVQGQAVGQPVVQGYAAPPAAQQMGQPSAAQAMYTGPAAQASHPSTAPPAGQPTTGQQAAAMGAQVAGSALGLAGKGLTSAGAWLAGKSKPRGSE